MDPKAIQLHWNTTYETKAQDGVSWYQDSPEPSLALVAEFAYEKGSPIIDIGGGASRLVDHLIQAGFDDVTVLDISEAALETARERLGSEGAAVDWIVSDIRTWRPARRYGVWHDRAALHFLVEKADRDAYLAKLTQALAPDGHAIIGTFAPDGPERCSGLPVQRYDSFALAETLGSHFTQVRTLRHAHVTPWGSPQSFQFSVFRRLPGTE
jgi:trans-aconitate methyltransferase